MVFPPGHNGGRDFVADFLARGSAEKLVDDDDSALCGETSDNGCADFFSGNCNERYLFC
jgi:hypothetical protein